MFQQLVSRELPQVSSHLEAAGADISCVFAQWRVMLRAVPCSQHLPGRMSSRLLACFPGGLRARFLCAYVNFLPLEACLRVWDLLFLARSSAVLFQVPIWFVSPSETGRVKPARCLGSWW